MNDLFAQDAFEPTTAAARARVAAVRPAAYARTRNAIDGDVTRLSPYLTHGLITLPQVLAGVLQRGPLPVQHKLVYEFGWREYFHHVWQHEADGIFESLHEGVLPDTAYAREMPADIRQAATGVPVIDQAVRELYATGYLHNHARMWLASYVVHLRKVHWRAGADWLYGHLLDGDLASNHLSWQWVAATGSHKPYLFNAENVARYAPASWHSPGTAVDAGYEALEAIARGTRALGPERLRAEAVAEPAVHTTPPSGVKLLPATAANLPAGAWLVHPWALREAPPGRPAIGVFVAAFHAQWPWTAARWQFVATRMAAVCERCVWLDGPPPAQVRGIDDPHLRPYWSLPDAAPMPRLFAEPDGPCNSFTQFYKRVAPTLQG